MDSTAEGWRSHFQYEAYLTTAESTQELQEGPRHTRGFPAAFCEWVEWPADESFIAYYDRVPLGTFKHLPADALVKFRGWEDEKGREFFEDARTGEVSWHLPLLGQASGSSSIKPGMAIQLRNTGYEHLDGAKAVVLARLQDHQVAITLASVWRMVIVKQSSVVPLAQGQVVRRIGADDPDEWVTITRTVQNEKTREVYYQADLLHNPVLSSSLHPSSILVKAQGVNPSSIGGLSIGPPVTYLQWGQNEQRCQFASSAGKLEEFFLHFPFGFEEEAEKAGPGETVRWPLLVYLHGNGAGGSFLTISGKKGLKTTGLQYAAENFIIVSPQCRWNWKGSPDEWVVQLVEELARADWVDPARMYMTGCSMGGMSTWILASQKPKLFAAIAPVGAYHKPDTRSFIAQSLGSCGGDVPIFAIQAKHDVTCPFKNELELYADLLRQHARLRVDVHPVYGHPEIWRAYADGTEVWKWMLSHQNTWCNTAAYEARVAANLMPETV